MTDLDEAHGWMTGAGVDLMPIARSLTPMKPRMIFFHTNGNGIGTSTPTGMFSSIQRQIAAGAPSIIIPNFEVGFSATAQFKSIFVAPSTQLAANGFSVGIETADSGAQDNPFGGITNEPWNPYQLGMLAKIAAFCARVGGVPLDRADAWNGHGCEGHCASNLIPRDTRGFTKPNVTTASGKICPGHARLNQIPGILAAARQLLEPPTPPVPPAPVPQPPAPITPPIPEGYDMDDFKPLYFTIIGEGRPEQIIASWHPATGWTRFIQSADLPTLAAARQRPEFGATPAVWVTEWKVGGDAFDHIAADCDRN